MNDSEPTLHDQLLRECDAMARQALRSGLRVSPHIIQELQRYLDRPPVGGTSGQEKAAPDPSRAPSVPAAGDSAIAELTQIHQALATAVAPATPRTILLLADQSKIPGPLHFLGPVPLVRHMMIVAIVSLFALIFITLSPDVNQENLNAGLLNLQGIELLAVEMLYVTAAAMGASFAALFTANHYIVEGTFDPKYSTSYWVRFILGIMAGVILADFVPADETSTQIHRPLLAILGGFSASLVYRILSRLVDTVESLFRGDPRDQIAHRDTTAKIHAEAQATINNAAIARRLMNLHGEVSQGADPKQITDRINQMVGDLIPTDAAEGSASDIAQTPPAAPKTTSARKKKASGA